MRKTTINRTIKVFGSLWICSGLLLPGLGLLSLVWQPPAFDTIMVALVIVCVLSGALALVLSFPQSQLPGTRCPRCGEVRRTGPGQFVGEVQGVCACR
jgi:hypothetical protein